MTRDLFIPHTLYHQLTFVANTTRATDPMYVLCSVMGKIKVDHVFDVLDVQSARSNGRGTSLP